MNIATIITVALILTNAACLFALVCAWEGEGYWQQEAQAAEALLGEARAEIADDNVIIAWQRKQIAGHLKDASVLLALSNYDEHRPLVPGEVADAVAEWLAGEQVQP